MSAPVLCLALWRLSCHSWTLHDPSIWLLGHYRPCCTLLVATPLTLLMDTFTMCSSTPHKHAGAAMQNFTKD